MLSKPLRLQTDLLNRSIGTADDRERLRLMLELADLLCHADAARADALLDACAPLADRVDDDLLKARLGYILGGRHIRFMEYGPALTCLNRAWKTIGEEETGFAGEILGRIGNVLTRRGDYERAEEILQRAMEMTTLDGDSRRIGVVLLLKGRLEYLLGRYHASYQQIMRASAMAQHVNDPMFHAQLQGSFCSIHLMLGQFDRAMEHAIASRDAFATLGYTFDEADLHTQIAMIHGSMEEYTKAKLSYEQAFAMMRASGYGYLVDRVAPGYGEVLARLGETDKAITIITGALESLSRLDSRRMYGYALYGLGGTLRKHGDQSKARKALEEALQALVDARDPRGEMHTLRMLADCCQELGDINAALDYFRRYDQARIAAQEGMTLMRVEQEKVREALEKSTRERDLLQRETDRLRLEMEIKGRELTAMAVDLARRNEDLQKLRLALEHTDDSDGILAQSLRRFLERRRGDEGWRAFERSFDAVHEGFIRELVATSPGITPTEIRVCTLLRLNLSTKEIASILSLSPHTVETHRRSIRRRLGLTPDENLVSRLAGIGGRL